MTSASLVESAAPPVQSWFFETSFFLLLLSFVLFPVAHLSVFGLPLYWSEAALVLSILLACYSNYQWLIGRLSVIISTEKSLFFFVSLFLSGIILSYFLHPHIFSGLGEIKSFYVLPIIFLIAVLVWGETKDRLWSMAKAWLLGLLAAVMASLLSASFGWYLYDGRLAGLYQSPNYLALLIAPAVLLALQLFQASAKGKREKILLIVSLVSVLSTLWLTRSYAACSAVGVALAIALVLGRRLRRFPYGPALLLIFVASIFIIGESGSEKWNSLFSGDDRSSLASRVMIWQSATKIAADSFPLGIGIGRFQEVYLEYQRFYPPYLEWAVPTPHNLSLHFFLEGGVLTLFGWLGCISYTLILAGRSLVLSGPSATRPHFLILGVALLVFYLIYGLVDTPYMKNDLALAVWGTLGFILAAEKIKA